ncbi:hypothetical protein ABKN59_002995 [Abortiporus biennis]
MRLRRKESVLYLYSTRQNLSCEEEKRSTAADLDLPDSWTNKVTSSGLRLFYSTPDGGLLVLTLELHTSLCLFYEQNLSCQRHDFCLVKLTPVPDRTDGGMPCSRNSKHWACGDPLEAPGGSYTSRLSVGKSAPWDMSFSCFCQ